MTAPKTSAQIEFNFSAQGESIPASLRVHFIACMVNHKNEPRVSQLEVNAPLSLVANPDTPK